MSWLWVVSKKHLSYVALFLLTGCAIEPMPRYVDRWVKFDGTGDARLLEFTLQSCQSQANAQAIGLVQPPPQQPNPDVTVLGSVALANAQQNQAMRAYRAQIAATVDSLTNACMLREGYVIEEVCIEYCQLKTAVP